MPQVEKATWLCRHVAKGPSQSATIARLNEPKFYNEKLQACLYGHNDGDSELFAGWHIQFENVFQDEDNFGRGCVKQEDPGQKSHV